LRPLYLIERFKSAQSRNGPGTTLTYITLQFNVFYNNMQEYKRPFCKKVQHNWQAKTYKKAIIKHKSRIKTNAASINKKL